MSSAAIRSRPTPLSVNRPWRSVVTAGKSDGMSSLGPVAEHPVLDGVGGLLPLQGLEPRVEVAGAGPEDADELDRGPGDGPALDVDHLPPDRHVVLDQVEHLHAVADRRVHESRPASLGHDHELGIVFPGGLRVGRRQPVRAIGAGPGQQDSERPGSRYTRAPTAGLPSGSRTRTVAPDSVS